MNFGKYRVERQNDGRYTIDFYNSETAERVIIWVDDVTYLFDELVKPKLVAIKEFAHLFQLALDHPQLWADQPRGQAMLNYLTNTQTPAEPAYFQGGRPQLWTHHLSIMLEAYNQTTRRQLTPQDVEPYLIELKRRYL